MLCPINQIKNFALNSENQIFCVCVNAKQSKFYVNASVLQKKIKKININLENISRKAEYVDSTLAHFTVHIIRQNPSVIIHVWHRCYRKT